MEHEHAQLITTDDREEHKWASLIFISLFMGMACGPLMAWPTLVPMLLEEGAFAGAKDPVARLNEIFSISMALAAVAQLPAGLLYDRIGPRAASSLGQVLTSCGLTGVAMCLRYPSLNGLLFLACPAASTVSFLTLWGGYAWLWMLPSSPMMVNAVIGAAMTSSVSLGWVASWLHRTHGVFMSTLFLADALVCLVGAVVCSRIVPSYSKNKANAAAVIRQALSQEAYDALLQEEAEVADRAAAQGTWLTAERELIADGWCVGLLHYRAVRHIMHWLTAVYMLPLSLMLSEFAFYMAMFDDAKVASYLVDAFALMSGGVGVVAVICFGLIADRIGTFYAAVICNGLAVGFVACVAVPTVGAQLMAQAFSVALMNITMVLVPRLCMTYAPESLFGTCSGLVFAALGVAQVVFTALFGTAASALLSKSSALLRQLIVIGVWAALTATGSWSLMSYWRAEGIPKAGTTTRADVRQRARTQHMCMQLKDASS